MTVRIALINGFLALMSVLPFTGATQAADNILPLEIAGITVVPHSRSPNLMYPLEGEIELGARVELYIRNNAPLNSGTNSIVHQNVVLFDGQEPQRLIEAGDWTWHDTPNIWEPEDVNVAPGALTVLRFNTKSKAWGLGKKFSLSVSDWKNYQKTEIPLQIAPQGVWISSVAFLSSDGNVLPDQLIFHVANRAKIAVKMVGTRLYLPQSGGRSLYPQESLTQVRLYPANGVINPSDKGVFRAQTGRLPLTHIAMEVTMEDPQGRRFPLWAYLKTRRASFDISGGWVDNSGLSYSTLKAEPFLKTLRRMHINTANIAEVPGYTDSPQTSGLYARYPLKQFGPLQPPEKYNREALMNSIHGIELLGDPQYETGKLPRSPQAVFLALQPYAKTCLPTTLTLSDESTWRHYAGLSDFPHFKAFRVCAPSSDIWTLYARWEGKGVGWGAPLETIGEFCRSLRDLNRPNPIAAWTQGPHFDWDVRDGRKRFSPTPDEMRLQAYHALANHVSSIYWHNLSLRALVQYRDVLQELTRINREIKTLEDFYLEGDAFQCQRLFSEGKPDWDLASIVGPRGAVLLALDLNYEPDRSAKTFEFKRRRDCRFTFNLPGYLQKSISVFRVDADGVYDVVHEVNGKSISIADKLNKMAIYVAAPTQETRNLVEGKRQGLLSFEESFQFDPANRNRDFEVLKDIVLGK